MTMNAVTQTQTQVHITMEINTWVTKSNDHLLVAHIPTARSLVEALVKMRHAMDVLQTYMPSEERLPNFSAWEPRYWIIEIVDCKIKVLGGKVWGYEYDALSNSYMLYKYFSPDVLVPVLQDIEDIILDALSALEKNIEANCVKIPVSQLRAISLREEFDKLYIYFDRDSHTLKISARPLLFVCY